MSAISHLECSRCAKQYEAGRVYNLCTCGSPLWVRYDLGRLDAAKWREQLAARPPNLWRYREVLPVRDESCITSLGEGCTPLLHARRVGEKLGLANLYLKDESLNPTGSFKARGMAVAVSMAHELGIERLAIPSAGNAGGALAAYAAKAGLEATVFMPEATPLANRLECRLFGAEVVLVPGSIKDCGRVLRKRAESAGWFDCSTLREPYRVEGKKTMAYEVFEQLEGRLPDAMIYPTGGGTGLIGMWKALAKCRRWAGSRHGARACSPCRRPAARPWCGPSTRDAEQAEEWLNPETIASGLRVPSAIGDFLILRVLRESRGSALAVEDTAMLEAVRELAEAEGAYHLARRRRDARRPQAAPR